ncbi:MAG: Integrase [Frankiales bacterium]|nr:Integrase [Frankiales bacterium]
MAADRKTSGESSVHQGADGRRHGYVSMGLKESGERDRRHVAALERACVARRVRELVGQRDPGIVLAGGRGLTVEQWMTLRLDTVASRKVRPSTLVGYRTCVDRISGHPSGTSASTGGIPSTWRASTRGRRSTVSPRRPRFSITA